MTALEQKHLEAIQKFSNTHEEIGYDNAAQLCAKISEEWAIEFLDWCTSQDFTCDMPTKKAYQLFLQSKEPPNYAKVLYEFMLAVTKRSTQDVEKTIAQAELLTAYFNKLKSKDNETN